MPFSPWALVCSSSPPQHAPAVRRAQGLPTSVPVPRLLSRSRPVRASRPSEPCSQMSLPSPTACALTVSLLSGHHGYFVEALDGPLSPSNPQFARAQKTCQKLAGGIY